VIDGGQHDRGAPELVFELVHRPAQRLQVRTVERNGKHLGAADVHGATCEVSARGRRELRLELRELALRGLRVVDELRELRLDLGSGRLQRRGSRAHRRLQRLNPGKRYVAGYRLDSANPRGNTALGDDLEEADIASACDVRAAA